MAVSYTHLDVYKRQYESFLSSIQNTALEQATNLTAKGEPVLKITIKHFDTDRIDTCLLYTSKVEYGSR